MRLIATFDDPGRLLDAVRRARERGFAVEDVFAPLPVHGLDEALGRRPSRLGLVTFAGGLAGMLGAVALQVYTAVVDWPLEVGGKPPNSALAFLPVTFELTVLAAGLATAAAFLLRSRLRPRLSAPRLPAARVTDDRFALVLAAPLEEAEARALLAAAGAVEVRRQRRRP